MRFVRLVLVLTTAIGLGTTMMAGQAPPAAGQRGTDPAAQSGADPAAARGGRGGGRGAMTTMNVLTTAWPDGGQIPIMYTQAGNETSPGIQWSYVPPGTQSFVLLFHDVDAPVGDGLSDILHWLVWNIPAAATQIPLGRPDGFTLPDGAKQISVSGSRYRGPGAPASGPAHHYLLELYALDTMLAVEPSPQAPSGTQGAVAPGIATRAAVMAAMAGHVRGKAAYVGLFKRPQ